MTRIAFPLATLLLTSACLTAPALASSDDGWEAFRQDVMTKCTALAAGLIEQPKVVVDPFGTESFGAAILSGKAAGADATVSAICIYDKKSKTAEIGGELPADQVTITIP